MSWPYPVLTVFLIICYGMGFYCATMAILKARTPQGAAAWVIGLVTIPFITVPLFYIFGSSKFYGYTSKRRILDQKITSKLSNLHQAIVENIDVSLPIHPLIKSLSELCHTGFSGKNKIELLIDAKETYLSMLQALEKATQTIVFEFYVFRVDSIGSKFLEVLMRKSRAGVIVHFLYDEIGTEIPVEVINDLKSAGVSVCHFNSIRGKGRFQVNFRNHRKIMIIDSKIAYVGGINIGDDYLGLWPEIGPWRDTQVKLEGPSVLSCLMTHIKDWYWCNQDEMRIDWKIPAPSGEANVLILPTGPADEKQICLLAHIAMVNSASEKLWIANPYLVPPESLLDAILLAALRGVDVRIIIPSKSDARIVMQASKVYVSRLLKHGVKVYRYEGGFLHQKVMLVDDTLAVVGSANIDFRSMFINFEISVVAFEAEFVKSVEAMLEQDFRQSSPILLEEFENLSLWGKISSRAANLVAPVL